MYFTCKLCAAGAQLINNSWVPVAIKLVMFGGSGTGKKRQARYEQVKSAKQVPSIPIHIENYYLDQPERYY